MIGLQTRQINTPENCKQPLLVLAVTSHVSMDFFKGQIGFLQKAGFRVAVVCSPGWDNCEGIEYYPIAMEREIAIVKDLRSLFLLIKLFNKINPAIVNAGTPKAGLLVGIAVSFNKVPIRIYTCHGLRLETLAGWKRKLLTVTEKIAACCAHHVVCVSNSLRQKFISCKLAGEEKVTVVGAGSCSGIDIDRFRRSDYPPNRPEKVLHGKKIAKNAVFIGFVGRLTKDKGIEELVAAFDMLKHKFPNLYLLLVGGFEDSDLPSEETRNKISRDDRIINSGFVDDPLPYYQLMRLLVLPTYREGLPTVLLEACAMELPVVATLSTGCVDVVVDGKTGLLVPVGDSVALADKIALLLSDKILAALMGQQARRRIEQLYRQEFVWNNMAEFYKQLLAAKQTGGLGRS